VGPIAVLDTVVKRKIPRPLAVHLATMTRSYNVTERSDKQYYVAHTKFRENRSIICCLVDVRV